MPSRPATVIEAARRLREQPLLGRGDLTIIGGSFSPERLEEFLTAWGLPRETTPHCLWETVSDWSFLHGSLPTSDRTFERAKFFGHGGELNIRREQGGLHWHFLGSPATPVASGFESRNFWDEYPDVRFRAHDATALLWGKLRDVEQGGHLWYDDRVGWARLAYPHPAAERLEIELTNLMDHGQIAFVWWKELRAHGKG